MEEVAKRTVLSDFFRSLFSVFFPDNCRLCERPLEEWTRVPVCRACLDSLPPLPTRAGRCETCGLPLASAVWSTCEECATGEYHFRRARSFGSYQDDLREAIHLLKYAGMTPLAKPLGARLAAVYRAEWEAGEVDAVVAVPLARARQRQRGYNQALLLARELARACGLPVIERACRRVRPTAPQTGLTRAQRLENLRGAFTAGRDARLLDGKRLLLVDDVFTTGATLSACARTLLSAGASEVHAITVARTLHE